MLPAFARRGTLQRIVVYVALTISFAGIFYVQHQALRSQPHIDLVRGRGGFWNISQVEYEHQRLMFSLLTLAAESTSGQADNVRLRFDIFWSRVTSLDGEFFTAGDRSSEWQKPFISQIVGVLEAIDDRVQRLEDTDREEARALLQIISSQEEFVHSAVLAQNVPLFGNQFIHRVVQNLKDIERNNFLMFGFFLVALTLLLIELRISHKRTRQERDARKTIEKADAAKVTFLANMSHELRTPLNAILGFSEVMKDEMLGKLGVTAYRDYAADIHGSGHLLLEMVNDILDFSRIEAGVIEASPEPFDIHAEATRTIHLVQRTAWEKQIRITLTCNWEPEMTTCLLNADDRLIRQALLNLITNAIKFTAEGGWIEVGLQTGEDQLTVSVSDSGKGISAENVDKVTDAFFQVNGVMTRREGGVGLGLAISRSFVEANAGRLEIASKVGVGTVVSMIFPSRLVVMTDTTIPVPVTGPVSEITYPGS